MNDRSPVLSLGQYRRLCTGGVQVPAPRDGRGFATGGPLLREYRRRAVTNHGIPIKLMTRYLVVLVAILAALDLSAQPARWTAEEWRADLDYLRLRIRTEHGNPFHAQDGQSLGAGFDALREAIPTMKDFDIAFAMQRLIAALGDGHSWLEFTEKGLARTFPLDAYAFSDGLFITRAGPGYDKAEGARIVAIEGRSIDAVRDALTPYISRDNEMDVLRQVPMMIRLAPALHAAGITADRDRATFSLISQDGEAFEQTFTAVAQAVFDRWEEGDRLPDSALPLYRRKNEVNYWYQALEGERALYFQFNRFVPTFGKPFDGFVKEMFEFIAAQDMNCMIIDVRHNGGGWTNLIDPLLAALRQHPRLSKQGHLYVITGRDTFSASLMLAVRLERQTGVIFAGEPGRGKPNSYGELGPFTLPNTGLRGSLSAALIQESEPFDPRTEVNVQLSAPLCYDDFRSNRDPALDMVLAHWREVRQ